MRVRGLTWLVLAAGGVIPSPAAAQGTKDQARLVFTISGGVVTGADLWSVPAQPVQFIVPADTFALTRRIRTTIGIAFAGTYFPGDNLGWGGEAFLVGLGYEDGCRHVFSSGRADVAIACASIQGATKSATAVSLSAGPIFRINSRSLFSPYARANLGLLFSSQSSIRMVGQFPSPDGVVDLVIYDDDSDSRVGPYLGVGLGVTAAVAKGYNLRLELRDNIMGVEKVTSATPEARTIPPHEVVYKHLFSLTFGFDVVLERRPGRRY
jgi:opacity protein-like surface antigen